MPIHCLLVNCCILVHFLCAQLVLLVFWGHGGALLFHPSSRIINLYHDWLRRGAGGLLLLLVSAHEHHQGGGWKRAKNQVTGVVLLFQQWHSVDVTLPLRPRHGCYVMDSPPILGRYHCTWSVEWTQLSWGCQTCPKRQCCVNISISGGLLMLPCHQHLAMGSR